MLTEVKKCILEEEILASSLKWLTCKQYAILLSDGWIKIGLHNETKWYVFWVQFQFYIKINAEFGAFLFVSKNCFSWIPKVHFDMKRTLYECFKKSLRILNMHITWDILLIYFLVFFYEFLKNYKSEKKNT